MFRDRTARLGFTLIELLVVISIIALLSSVVLSSLNAARSKSRDARRIMDLKSMQTAVELYRNDNASFPSTGNSWWGNCSAFGSRGITGPTAYIPNVAPAYIAQLPLDPRPVGNNGCYLYRSDGVDYILLAYLTVENSPIPASFRRVADPAATYAVYSAGARTW